MDLALVVASLRAGGTERVVTTLAAAFADAGHRVVVVTESSDDMDHFRLEPGLRRLALDVERETKTPLERITANVLRVRSLRAGILSEQAQAVVAFGDKTSVRAVLACVGTGIPVVVSERTDPRRHRIPCMWDWLRRRMYKRAAAVVVPTESVAEWTRSFVEPASVHVIPNAVRPAVPPAAPPEGLPNGKVLMAVGRFTAEKGFDLLIDAFAQSGLHASGWHLVILGEGPHRNVLETRVRDFGLRRSISLPGLVAEPVHWLHYADLFVLSSLYEGFPNALLEAMACGAAAISFDCPSGPSDIIRNCQTGVLVPPGNVGALADAMRALAADPQRRRTLAAAAAADINARFALPGIIKQWEAVLHSVTHALQPRA